MNGPYESEADVSALAEVRAVYDAARATSRRGVMGERNHELLCRALDRAGVELGAYDHRIVQWLAGWEPKTVAVIAGWVTRAAQAGEAAGPAVGMVPRDRRLVLDALDDAAEWRDREADSDSPQGGMREADLDQAGAYRALAARIGGQAACGHCRGTGKCPYLGCSMCGGLRRPCGQCGREAGL